MAIALAFYLDAVGWDSVGSVVGVAYRSAAAATSWTISQLHGPPAAPRSGPAAVDP